MAKTTDNENKNGGENTPPVKPAIKMVKYRNNTSGKLNFGFAKNFYTVPVGGEIEIPENLENLFIAEHGRANILVKVSN